MRKGAHLRLSGDGNGAFTLEIDGVDFSKSVLADDFSISLEQQGGQRQAVAHITLATENVAVDVRDVVLKVTEAVREQLARG